MWASSGGTSYLRSALFRGMERVDPRAQKKVGDRSPHFPSSLSLIPVYSYFIFPSFLLPPPLRALSPLFSSSKNHHHHLLPPPKSTCKNQRHFFPLFSHLSFTFFFLLCPPLPNFYLSSLLLPKNYSRFLIIFLHPLFFFYIIISFDASFLDIGNDNFFFFFLLG